MKEEYLSIAKCYEKLAENYRALAESCILSADLSKAEDMTGGLAEDNSKAEPVTEESKSEEKTIPFEEVSLLAKKKAADGKSAGVKSIILRFNAKKLSDISSENYADVIKELEAL